MGSEKKPKKRRSRSLSPSDYSSSEEEENRSSSSKRHRSRDDDKERRRRRSKKDDKEKKTKSHKTSKQSDKGKKSEDKEGHKRHKRKNILASQELSNDDYFSKNNEFATWLKEKKKIFFSDLSSEDARDLFSGFIKDWNKGKLEDRYYEGIATGPRTAHNWKLA